jgi:outer membrane protein assembly factor BamE (lipoprotein component of BamABCDE complex)
LRPIAIRPLHLLLLTGLAVSASACAAPDFMTFPPQTRGNKVDPELLSQLVPGTSSRADATALIGSPTARATFDDNTWIYIAEVTKPIIGGTQRIREQQVLVLTFDQGGTLRNIEKRGQEDSQPVDVVSRSTPSPGNNASVLQQLLGNVGRFSPGGSPGQKQNNTGGTGSANNF